MTTAKKGKLPVNVRQGSKKLNTLWPVKYCVKAGSNLFSLTCKSRKGNNISVEKNSIVLETVKGNTVMDCQIKTHDG